MVRRLIAVLLLVASAGPCGAWGFEAHRTVNRGAIATLPQELRPLFEANADYLAEHSIDPDLWRTAGRKGEEPNHFLDLDAFGVYPFETIPHDEAEHLRRHGAEAALQGRAPWRVAEVYGELAEAFGERDPARILERAAILGHYVGDVHVPLHAVSNYDGQLSGQKGVHARWEEQLFGRFERQLVPQLAPKPARPRRDPVELTFTALLESFREAEAVLQSDKAAAGRFDFASTPYDDRYDDRYYSRFYEREERRLVARLQAASERLASLWLGAWDEAGRPELAAWRFPYVRRRSRLVLLTLDGASRSVVDDALARGVMPHLAKLRSRGSSGSALSSLPAKTPPGHAALYTGAWSDRNGIAGTDSPEPGASILTAHSGFTSELLRAEPIWVTAARQGLDVSVISATQTWPFAPFLEERRFGGNYGWRLSLLNGYQNRETTARVLSAGETRLRPAAGWQGGLPPHRGAPRELDLSVAGVRLEGLLYDDPDDPTDGYDTLYLATRKGIGTGVALKAGPTRFDAEAFRGLVVRNAGGDVGLHFRLFTLKPDGSDFLLFVAGASALHSNRAGVEAGALKASGGFAGNGADDLYKAGAFGAPLWDGGDGSAEARYLETVHLVARQFERLMEFGLEATKWDMLVGYLPFPDEQLHLWYGYLDPSLEGHDPALARAVAPLLDSALALTDGFVGHVAERLPEDALIAIGADHGTTTADRTVRLNVALQRAGLLSLTPEGEVDLARTRAIYFPGNSGYFLVNRVARQEGVVPPEEEPQVIARLKASLLALRDPATRGPIVSALLDPRDGDHEPGIGGPIGGDLYFDLAPGYYPSTELRGELVSPRRPSGEHLLGPQRPEMHAAFVVAGPGVAEGVELGAIRQIDIAPTLCALLGIEAPAQAQGRVLARALAHPTPNAAPR